MRLTSLKNPASATHHRPDGVTVYHLVIAHPAGPCVLMFRDGDSWTLPFFEPQEHHFAVVDHINHTVKESLGIDTTVIRCVSYRFTQASNRVDAIYLLEAHDPEWITPESGSWIRTESVNELCITPVQYSSIILDCLTEVSGTNTPVQRRPWARVGWFTEAEHWIGLQLGNEEILSSIYIEQMRTWERSCILRATACNGTYYFKAMPERLINEQRITQVLSGIFSQNSVELAAVNLAHHWMLMKQLSGTLLTRVSDPGCWKNALSEFARIQIYCSSILDDVAVSSCPNYRLDILDVYLDELLADESALHLDEPAGLSMEQFVRLQSLVPAIKSALLELANYDIPYTLTHGDFWAGNVVEQNEKYTFFDWSDVTISHPFFDLTFFLEIDEGLLPTNSYAVLRDAYLEAWSQVRPEPQVRAAYDVARRLSWVHKALVEHRLILAGIEDAAKWEFANALPYYLKKAINAWA